jgi:hypothetical protein
MLRNLTSGRLLRTEGSSEFNPMDGLANLADVMLVFACGLLLALVASFNVDWDRSANLVGITQGEEIAQIEGLADGAMESSWEDAGLEELGRVLRDPVTGTLYMVTDIEN